MPFLSLIFIFSLLLSKTLSFSRSPQNLSQKNDDPGLIHRWIVAKFEYHVRNRSVNTHIAPHSFQYCRKLLAGTHRTSYRRKVEENPTLLLELWVEENPRLLLE